MLKINNKWLMRQSINFAVDYLPIDGNNRIAVYTNCADFNAGNTGGHPHLTFEGKEADVFREWANDESFDLMKEWQ